MPKVSVIVTCYNLGAYLDEAVDSVLAQTFRDFEIVIVNDGSTDESTIALLKNYNKPKTTVIHTPNQGLSEARNTGIRNSSGEYILPLDADDKISPGYLADAVRVLDNDSAVKIVYSDGEGFGGEYKGPLPFPPFSMQTLLTRNMIPCSAFFRRRDYDLTVGYNKNMPACEDWDFWLSILEKGGKVYKIPKVHFYYRYRSDSIVNSSPPELYKHIRRQIYLNHIELYAREFYDPLNLYWEKIGCEERYKAGRLLSELFRVIKLPIRRFRSMIKDD